MPIPSAYHEIKQRLTRFNAFNKKIAVILVVKLQSEALAYDYEKHSVITTYLSDREMQDLVDGFGAFADYVDVAYGELDLLQKLQSNYYDFLNDYHKIVYSENASGLHRSKSAHIPAICELFGINFCSNDIFTAALLDNKMAVFNLLAGLRLPIPGTWFYKTEMGWIGEKPSSDLLLIAKPAYECASIGIEEQSVSLLTNEFLNFIDSLSVKFDQPIIVQQFIEGSEVEVPIFEDKSPYIPCISGISLNGESHLGSQFLGYDTVFDDGFELYSYDDHNLAMATLIKNISLKTYQYLQLRGPVRIDYRINKDGDFYITDFNNSPHLGKQHSFAFSLQHLGFSYADMLKLVILRVLPLK